MAKFKLKNNMKYMHKCYRTGNYPKHRNENECKYLAAAHLSSSNMYSLLVPDPTALLSRWQQRLTFSTR